MRLVLRLCGLGTVTEAWSGRMNVLVLTSFHFNYFGLNFWVGFPNWKVLFRVSLTSIRLASSRFFSQNPDQIITPSHCACPWHIVSPVFIIVSADECIHGQQFTEIHITTATELIVSAKIRIDLWIRTWTTVRPYVKADWKTLLSFLWIKSWLAPCCLWPQRDTFQFNGSYFAGHTKTLRLVRVLALPQPWYFPSARKSRPKTYG